MKRLVVKVGGSLFDLPDLAGRLRTYLHSVQPAKICLVAGGGAAAEHVRRLDRLHRLGQERSHWLALRAMSLQARLLAGLLADLRVADSLIELQSGWGNMGVVLIDAFEVLLQDENSPDHLPHDWSATSDSVAARLAVLLHADELILLKSCPVPASATLEELHREGVVDAWFPHIARSLPLVRIVNFRSTPLEACTIRASR